MQRDKCLNKSFLRQKFGLNNWSIIFERQKFCLAKISLGQICL